MSDFVDPVKHPNDHQNLLLTTTSAPITRHHGNAYEIFILVVTVLSLAVMGSLLLPLDQATLDALLVWDNVICLIFLVDFAYNITGSRPRREYFLHQRGWLDLLGSIPSLGVFRLTALLRLARLSRLTRIVRILGGQNRKQLVRDVIQNRGQYALFITVLLALVTVSVSSIIVLQFESRSPDANITTGGDALWWAVVTITTVGYGDTYPVTSLGRLTGVFVMFAGIGIIGALASILASLLVAAPPPTEEEEATEALAKIEKAAEAGDLKAIRGEMADLRAQLTELNATLAKSGSPDST